MEWLSEQSADDGCRVERRHAWEHRNQRRQDSIELFVTHDPRVWQHHARQQRDGWQPDVRESEKGTGAIVFGPAFAGWNTGGWLAS